MTRLFTLLALLLLPIAGSGTSVSDSKVSIAGDWIGACPAESRSDKQLSTASILLRKEFSTSGMQIEEARLNISGLGFYELYVNGRKIGQYLLQPLWSDYDKTVYYNSYDIRKYLKKGNNCIGVMLGNGFYNVQGGRYTKFKRSYGPPSLLAELTLITKDGREMHIKTNSDWKWSPSPITFNCIFGGEDYDAGAEQKDWSKAGFDESGWNAAALAEVPKGELLPQDATGDEVIARYKAQRTWVLDDGRIAMDMAQNLSGVPSVRLRGRKGQTVKIYPAEVLDQNGVPNQEQSGSPHYYSYTLGTDGKTESYTPRFTYYGFRYLLVEGAILPGMPNPDGLPVLRSSESLFLSNALAKPGKFSCSNEIFNGAHRLIGMAIRSNMHSVFTDCPHREKLSWLEQLQFNGPVLFYNLDLRQFAPKVMRDMADAQHADGLIPTIAPEYTYFGGDFSNSPEWGSSFIVWPLIYCHFYRDSSLIKDYYPKMQAYLDYLGSCAENGILSFGLGDWYDYAGGRSGFAQNTSIPMVASAQYYLDMLAMREAALILGKDSDAAQYADMAATERELINYRFFDHATSNYDTGSQAANAVALYLGLVPEEHHDALLANLLADIQKHGGKQTAGEVTNRFLYGILHKEGLDDVLFKMHNDYKAPGYGHQLASGATTLTEQWDPSQGASQNHFMFGHIDEWFYGTLAGIEYQSMTSDSPYTIIIKPVPVGDLTSVKAEHGTIEGLLKVKWTISRKGIFKLTVDIPGNLKTAVQLPGTSSSLSCHSGTNKYKIQLSR